jgi:hypothetical protein
LVIIWLKRWSATELIDAPLESAPVGVGVGVGDALALGEGVGVGVTVGVGVAVDEGVGVGVDVGVGDGLGEQSATSSHVAAAGRVWAGSSSAEITTVSAAEMINRVEWPRCSRPIIVSARTGCRCSRPPASCLRNR